jgi:hypothetical protein
MNCWHCATELIWGGDHDMEDNEDYDIITIYRVLIVIQQLMFITHQNN